MSELITIVGPSGVGKTALVNALAKAGNPTLSEVEGFATAFEQHNERPFQALFKKDKRHGLANQVDFFLLRAEQERVLRAASQIGLIDGGLDLDYHGFTRIFHQRGLLTDSELDLCQRLYDTLRVLMPLPELIVRLRADEKTVADRLSARDRINIASRDDFALFESFLDEWLESVDPIQILEVDVSEDDPEYSHLIPALLTEISDRFGKI